MTHVPAYVLGHSSSELARLVEQGRFFGDLTEDVFLRAGLRPGMRVLDVGSGAGDVSFLLAKIVGSNGFVLGVDRSAEAVNLATRRAAEAGVSNVVFRVDEAEALDATEPFDAVIGRLVLMYAADPAALVRAVTRLVRTGGIVCFHECDVISARSEPPVEVFDTSLATIIEALRRSGANVRMGSDLYRVFVEAGLLPKMIAHARVEAGPDSPIYDVFVALAQTLTPVIERLGLSTREDLGLDSLSARLREAAAAQNAVIFAPQFVGAWAVVTPDVRRRSTTPSR